MASKDGGGLGPENQKRLLQTLFFMPNTDLAFIRGIIEKLPNRWAEYSEFLAWAIIGGKKDVADFLITDGASLDDPPHELSSDTFGASPEITEALKSYRRTPFLILAASRGNEEMVDMLLSRGASLQQAGFVGTSKSRLNAVITNVLGAAVFHGKTGVVRWLLGRFRGEEIGLELQTLEERGVGKGLSKEYSGCTPLLLSIHRNDTPEIATILLSHGAKATAVDWQQNNALHIAASLHKTDLVQYFNQVEGKLKRDRNSKGETAFSIAKEKGFANVFGLLGEEDQSAKEAEELFDQLRQEEQKKPKKPRKKKQHPEDPPKPVSATVPVNLPVVEPVPAIVPATVETVQEEVKSVPAKSEELSALQKRIDGKTSFSGMSHDELSLLRSELESALAAVTATLSQRTK